MSTHDGSSCALSLLLLLCLPLSLAAQEPGAFDLLGDEPASSLAAVRSWQIVPRFDVLRAAPARLELSLGAGETRAFDRTDFESRGAEDYTWRGRMAEGEGSVVLTVHGKALAGYLEADGTVYEIVPRGRDAASLVLLDSDRFPECAGEASVAGDPSPPSLAAATFSTAAHPDPQGRIDVMMLYTASALASAGGESNLRTTAQAALDAANTSYANSQITTRLRLVHVQEVGYTESELDYADHVAWLSSDPGVAALREAYRADLVTLLVQDPRFCGMAYLMGGVTPGFASSAFSSVTLSCAVGNLSFAHELGHTMGAHHDPANGLGMPAFPFAYGHFVNGSFRTVMAYNNQCSSGCTRVARFSNPNISYLGSPTGVAEARDNHRTLNGTDAVAANFRQEVTASDFFTLTPCRLADTRSSTALASGAARVVQAGGVCGIPADAASVVLNVTMVGATGDGYLRLYTSGIPKPESIAGTFVAGRTLANNAVLLLPGNGSGTLTAEPFVAGGGTVHMVIDVFGYFALPAQDVWTSQQPLPQGRTVVASAVAGGRIWVIGGQLDSGQIVSTVEAFDPATGQWQTGCPMPTARAFATAVEAGGKIYVYGGRARLTDSIELSTVERFDPTAACATAWSARAAMPAGRSQAAAAVANGRVYFAGGAGTPQTLYEHDPATDAWTLKATLPSPKTDAAAVAVDGRIYVLGGGGAGDGGVLVYDPATNGWSLGAALPVATSGNVAAEIGGKIYSVGGSGGVTQEYDPQTDSWQQRSVLPTNRANAAAGVVNGHFYVIGGTGATGIQDANEMYVPPGG
jgi:peptidyl-Asp metalloendopeptidase